jgi:hypothetical protein
MSMPNTLLRRSTQSKSEKASCSKVSSWHRKATLNWQERHTNLTYRTTDHCSEMSSSLNLPIRVNGEKSSKKLRKMMKTMKMTPNNWQQDKNKRLSI